jgi:phosphatidylglycerophosphatase A
MNPQEPAVAAPVTPTQDGAQALAPGSAQLAPWPLTMIVTWLGCGLSPRAPGTVGTLGALPFAWGICWAWGPWALAAAGAIAFFIGWVASEAYVRIVRHKDPGQVVIDEVAAVWLTLAVAPLDPAAYVIGFIFFRIADIAKPWPVSWADRRLGGGFGIMVDDVMAAAYAAPVLWLTVEWFGIGA